MNRALIAFLSAIRAEVARRHLPDAEVIGVLLDLAIEHRTGADLDPDQLRFELDKRLLELAVADLGRTR